MPTAFTVGDEADINSALEKIDLGGASSATNTDYTITLAPASGKTIGLTSALEAINLASGDTLTIEGDDDVIDGGGTQRGFFVYSGDVTIENLTIEDTRAVGGAGGAAREGGGGGAGLGGGLFVAGTENSAVNGAAAAGTPASVTLIDVGFAGDGATGGSGGSTSNGKGLSGAGGGLGGAGSSGGGGIGEGAIGGRTPGGGGGAGIVQDAAGGGKALGGKSGGGGGGGRDTSGGGGGGVGGGFGYVDNIGGGFGGAGGFGGGGGAGSFGADADGGGGAGGFGGGGGGGIGLLAPAGGGGFGGGGGGAGPGIPAGAGGFGGGEGEGGSATGSNGGGGGLGAGGDIFVQQGGSLTIEDGSSLGAGAVSGGSGFDSGSAGSAYGGGIFIQGGTAADPQTLTLGAGQTAGQTTTVSGVIADEAGSGGTSGQGGADTAGGTGALVVEGQGTVALDPMTSGGGGAANSFAGGIEIISGVLDLDQPGAAGTGAITFAAATQVVLAFAGAIAAHSTVAFAVADAPPNPFVDFGAGDLIDVTDLSSAGLSHSDDYVGDDDTLTLKGMDETTHEVASISLTFDGYQGGFEYHADGDGTEIAMCFCPGTLILTDKDEVAVEALAIGDRVATLHGGARAIKWIGRRSYDGRFLAGQPLMLPVRIGRGAIEDGAPARDLFVSPGHAICVDGVLVPAWRLVNGVSITQARSVDRVTYIHLEFDDHEVIFAEGCPVESFLDDGFRQQFHNAAEYRALYPKDEPGRGERCLPRIEEGFHLEAIQRRLAARAGVEFPTEQDGPLRGYVDLAGPEIVAGWAQCEARPEIPVCLDILVDGRRVMRALANRYRADLRQAGLGSGKHAFEVPLPEGVRGRVEVRRSSDHARLAPTEAATRAA